MFLHCRLNMPRYSYHSWTSTKERQIAEYIPPPRAEIKIKGLKSDSVVLLERIRTIDKRRLNECGRTRQNRNGERRSCHNHKFRTEDYGRIAWMNIDGDNASFAYGINILDALLNMKLITREEYDGITEISANHYDINFTVFNWKRFCFSPDIPKLPR